MILEFDRPYKPCLEAAEANVRLAEVHYEVVRTLGMNSDDREYIHQAILHLKNARDRLWKAQDIARQTRVNQLGKALGIWS